MRREVESSATPWIYGSGFGGIEGTGEMLSCATGSRGGTGEGVSTAVAGLGSVSGIGRPAWRDLFDRRSLAVYSSTGLPGSVREGGCMRSTSAAAVHPEYSFLVQAP
jgi:hypothetical protein